jgi:hypothetical protein
MLYTYQADRYLAQGRIPTLGGSDKLLMEFSLDIRYERWRRPCRTCSGAGGCRCWRISSAIRA